MIKAISCELIAVSLIILSLFLAVPVQAANNAFVNIVNPVRGSDFWDAENQKPLDAVSGQTELAKKYRVPITWLLRYDALVNSEIINYLQLNSPSSERGLFLEVTPSWAKNSGVSYRESEVWHLAGSVFLTGYSVGDREKLIDQAFLKFKSTWGFYPTSVGAWWIDAYSLKYMQSKYKVTVAMIVADQFNTDNYQVWGQYFSSPYYSTSRNTLFPAQTLENKIPVVIVQWAARDPVNGYGSGVQESTYSVQVNDYQDYHNLGADYFSKLVDIYTTQPLNQVNQLVVGLENSYPWERFKLGYEGQLKVLTQKRSQGQLQITKLSEFGEWYQDKFPRVSPAQVISAVDPLGTEQRAVWLMNPYYRAGWFYDNFGSRFRDIRPYDEGQAESCYLERCDVMRATTQVVRVLDEITLGRSLTLDQGKISNFKVERVGDQVKLSYQNEAGRGREIDLMPRDIAIDGSVRTIDGTILSAEGSENLTREKTIYVAAGDYLWPQLKTLVAQALKFLAFFVLAIIIPGYLLTRKVYLGILMGLVNLTLVGFLAGYLKLGVIVYFYLGLALVFFIYKGHYRQLFSSLSFSLSKKNLFLSLLILTGTIFQSLALVRSGWAYDFGIGFWGPLGHDLVWHLSLINQLVKNIPPENPIFSGEQLVNYHYFYDLLVALTYKLSSVPVIDLIFRFYPILLSLLLGTGTYILSMRLFRGWWSSVLAVYFVYFAGSFGWIVDFIKYGNIFSGESAFWANQAISFNLNPPFAISLVLLIGIILALQQWLENKSLIGAVVLILLSGSLIEFKAYGGILMLVSLALVSLQQLIVQKKWSLLKITIPSSLLSSLVFLPQNSGSGSFLVFQPFWFIHSMIDYPDRIGWLKLSMARSAYFERGEYLKYLLAEGLGLFMFIAGNLGMRVIGLVQIIKNGINFNRLDLSILVYLTLLSIIIPIFLTQQGNTWNTIQFLYYGLYLTAVFSGYLLYRIFQSLPTTLGIITVILILIITPINSVATFQGGLYKYPPSRLSHAEFSALNFLSTLPDGVVLTYPFDKHQRGKFRDPFKLLVYETTSYVSAFSAKPSFIEDEIQHEIFLNSYKKRVIAAYDFFNRKDYSWSRNFLAENKIRYIYLPKLYKVSLDPDKLNLKQIFENSETLIFEVNDVN